MKSKRVNKWIVVSTVLAIILLCIITYTAVLKYKQMRNSEIAQSFQDGMQYGYRTAVSQLIDSAESCQPVDIFLDNETVKLISVDCVS